MALYTLQDRQSGENACGVGEALQQSRGKATPSLRVLGVSFLRKGGFCWLELPRQGAALTAQAKNTFQAKEVSSSNKQLQGRRKGGEAAPGFLEINCKFRRLLLLSAVQPGRKEMITLLYLAS